MATHTRVLVSALFIAFAACAGDVGVACLPGKDLARKQNAPGPLALDETHVYWVNESHGSANGAVKRVAKIGGNPEILADGLFAPAGIAVDDEAVYWIECGARSDERKLPREGRLWRVAKAGGKPDVLVANLTTLGALAIDDQYVYLNDGPILLRIPKQGGEPEELADLTNSPTNSPTDGRTRTLLSIGLDEHQMYFTDEIGYLRSVPKVGGEIRTVMPSCNPTLWAIAGRLMVVADGHVYWLGCGGVALYRAGSEAARGVVLVPRSYILHDVAITPERLYFTVDGGDEAGGVYAIDPAGRSDAEMLAGAGIGFWGIAVDAEHVYYTNYAAGTVRKLDRNRHPVVDAIVDSPQCRP